MKTKEEILKKELKNYKFDDDVIIRSYCFDCSNCFNDVKIGFLKGFRQGKKEAIDEIERECVELKKRRLKIDSEYTLLEYLIQKLEEMVLK